MKISPLVATQDTYSVSPTISARETRLNPTAANLIKFLNYQYT